MTFENKLSRNRDSNVKFAPLDHKILTGLAPHGPQCLHRDPLRHEPLIISVIRTFRDHHRRITLAENFDLELLAFIA